MASTKDLKRRIQSVKKTQQITKAMNMVAAAKLRRAQDLMANSESFISKVSQLLVNVKKNKEYRHFKALKSSSREENVLIVPISGDGGLCGSFNQQVIKETEKLLAKYDNCKLIPVGKKVRDYLTTRHKDKIIKEKLDIFNSLKYEDAEEIARFVFSYFQKNDIDKVFVLSFEFKNVISQNLNTEQILPIEPDAEYSNSEYLFEPVEEEIIEVLARQYVDVTVWNKLLHSLTSVQAARMVAMDNATENASEVIRNLTLLYNKARQAGITTEILEITSGAEALK